MHVESGTICGTYTGYWRELLGTEFLAKGASTWDRLLDAALLLLYTSLGEFVCFIPCYLSGKSLYDAQLLSRMDEKSSGQQQEGQTSLTSSTVSPSVAPDPIDNEPIQDGLQGQAEQKPKLKDYFVCCPISTSIKPCLIVFSASLAMQPKLTFLPTLWVLFRLSRRELLYH